MSKGLLQLREAGRTERERSATVNQVVVRVTAIADRSSLTMRPLNRNPSLNSAWAEAGEIADVDHAVEERGCRHRPGRVDGSVMDCAPPRTRTGRGEGTSRFAAGCR